jgi:hypothetical protein
MSAPNTFQSLTLRRHSFSFTEGLASAFDYTSIASNYHLSPTASAADAHAIASDFIVTGNDMRAALADYGRAR